MDRCIAKNDNSCILQKTKKSEKKKGFMSKGSKVFMRSWKLYFMRETNLSTSVDIRRLSSGG